MAHEPGDEIIPSPDVVMDRVLSLPAPAAQVWPWLVQLGKHRAGWYLPGVIEGWFIPASRRAARRIEPRWQKLQVGDEIDDWGGADATLRLAAIDPPRSLVWVSTRARRSRPPLVFSWALVLRDGEGGGCDVHLRLRMDLAGGRKWTAKYVGGAVDLTVVKLLEKGLRERVT